MNEYETTTRTPDDRGEEILANLDCYTLLKDLLKNWWVILLAGITACLVVNMLPYLSVVESISGIDAISGIGYRPMYTASTTVIVTGTARSGDSFSTYSSNAERFTNILTDEYILQEVAEDMGLRKLAVEVKAEVIADSNMVSLSVRSNKPTMSYRVIKGILQHYSDISEMMYPGYVLEELVPAAYPSEPDNSYDVTDMSRKCAAAAMAVTAVLILMLSYYYDSVKNEKDVERKLDTKLYAAIYHERKHRTFRMLLPGRRRKKKSLMISSPVASFGFVESYRRLRERLVARCNRSGKKVILITSMLENEGKSTVAANLALALAGISDNVLLLDADLRKPAQHKIFELKEEKHEEFSDYLYGKATLTDCLTRDEESGIYMIYNKNNCSASSEILGGERMKNLIVQMKSSMDYIIIDTPPVEMVADAETLTRYADYSLLVITPDHAPTEAVNDCIDQLKEGHAKLLGCVLNNIHTVPLLIRQVTGINVFAISGGSYGRYSGYGYGGGYGYGTKEEYGQDSSGSRNKKKQSLYNSRETVSGKGFFAERVSRTSGHDEEE
ncbi:MAG: polysaccharide biosynthesis tyrosine autokinase [Lachnospiraceae bacterium]